MHDPAVSSTMDSSWNTPEEESSWHEALNRIEEIKTTTAVVDTATEPAEQTQVATSAEEPAKSSTPVEPAQTDTETSAGGATSSAPELESTWSKTVTTEDVQAKKSSEEDQFLRIEPTSPLVAVSVTSTLAVEPSQSEAGIQPSQTTEADVIKTTEVPTLTLTPTASGSYLLTGLNLLLVLSRAAQLAERPK